MRVGLIPDVLAFVLQEEVFRLEPAEQQKRRQQRE